MSEVPSNLKKFLVRNRRRFKEREFLITILTRTANRPVLFLAPAFIEDVRVNSANGDMVKVDLTRSLSKPIYPDMVGPVPKEKLATLHPILQWSFEHNLPRIVSEDPFQILKEYQNWSCLSDEEKAIVDESSKAMRDCTEAEYYEFMTTRNSLDDRKKVIELIDDQSGKRYLADLVFQSGQSEVRLQILSDNLDARLMTEIDTFPCSSEDIPFCKEPCVTTVGRFIVNQLFLDPFDGKFPYQNQEIYIDNGDIIDLVTKAREAGELDLDAYKEFMNNVYFLGHFTELCTPCLSERALSTDPAIQKRKAELFEQYKGRLDDPIVIATIEKELIDMDKAYIKGDVAERFYKPLGGKTSLWRKKTYIAVGGVEDFSKDSSKYVMIPNSLEEGMTLQDLPKYGNESRKGSYQRGHETRNGGALTKYIIRAFHDSRITEDNCGTERGVTVDFSRQEIKKFMGRMIWLNGAWTVITSDNVGNIPKGVYKMRSPMYCEAKNNGYCYACMGQMFRDMGWEQLTLTAVDITTTFMNAAMKNMHGSNVAYTEVSSLDAFVL